MEINSELDDIDYEIVKYNLCEVDPYNADLDLGAFNCINIDRVKFLMECVPLSQECTNENCPFFKTKQLGTFIPCSALIDDYILRNRMCK